MHFARTLRAAGLPVGPGRVLDAIRAVEAVGIGNREDFYWALHATLVNRRDQQETVRSGVPHLLAQPAPPGTHAMAMLLPQMRGRAEKTEDQAEMSRRLAEALGQRRRRRPKAKTGGGRRSRSTRP